MQSKHELSVKGEECWQELQTHIEWSDKFELFILFTHNPLIAKIIRQRVTLIFSSNKTPIHYFEPTTPATLIADVFDFLQPLENENLPDEERSPIWLEISQWSEQWSPVQRSLIERMNERRDRLRKHHPRPFIIVMNGDFSQQLRTISPDLWSVRCYSRILTPDFIILPKVVDEIGLLAATTTEKPDVIIEKYDDIQQHPTIKEWQRLVDKGAEGLDVFWAGYDAFNLAFNAGLILISEPISSAISDIASQLESNPKGLKALFASLICKGALLKVKKELKQAAKVFSKSLAVARQLQQLQGDQVEVLRDISISLNQLGEINLSLKDSNQALAQFSESLALRRQLQRLQGEQPNVLNDVSISLDELGDLHQSLGHSNQAFAQISESLALRRQLKQLVGDQPTVLRDISISLSKLGDINLALGHSNQALAQLSESVTLFRQLKQLQGEQPVILKDLFLSLAKLATFHHKTEAMDIARGYYLESLEVIEQLKIISPEDPNTEGWTNLVSERLEEIDSS